MPDERLPWYAFYDFLFHRTNLDTCASASCSKNFYLEDSVSLEQLLCKSYVFNYNFSYSGNYLKFYGAIKHYYPDINIISNCDGSYQKLDHPADLYDYHVRFFTSKHLHICYKLQVSII